MARAGKKRRAGQREANGRLQRPTLSSLNEIRAESERKEKVVVLSQPHRNGDTSQLRESPLGRLVLENRLDHRLYDAGRAYAGLVARLRRAKGVPVEQNGRHSDGLGLGPSDEAVRRWQEDEKQIRTALMRADGKGHVFFAIDKLCLQERENNPGFKQHAVTGLKIIAVELGMMSAREQPFA